DLAEPFGAEPAHPGDAVLPGGPLDAVQALGVVGVPGHQDLADLLVRQVALGAVLAEQQGAAAAQRGLERSRAVVQAGVDHAAVPAGLVRGDPVLLLQHGDPCAGPLPGDPPGQGQPDDPAADDADVLAAHGRPR